MAETERLTARVCELVVRSLGLQIEADQLDADEPLFGGDATVDSMGSLEIVAAMEREFGFEIPDDDLRAELFESIRSLADYAARRLANQGQTAAND